jgi:hypothetical protein
MSSRPKFSLQGVEDVQVPSNETVPFARRAQTCTLRIEIRAGNPNPDILQLLGHEPCVMQVWLSTTNLHKVVTEVVLVEQLVYQNVSFGMACPLCIARAFIAVHNTSTHRITLFPIVLKLRKITKDADHLTEMEAKKAVRTWETDEIRDMFPYLYLLGKLHTRGGDFECIGTEGMVPSPINANFQVNDFYFQYMQEAYKLVKRLHQLGFAHGDPHRSNFMMVPKESNHPVFNPLRLIMIDQDTLQELPHPDQQRDLYNALILKDLSILSYQANPWMPVLEGLKPEQMAWMLDTLCMSHPEEVLHVPSYIFFYKGTGLDELQRSIDEPTLRRYKQSLLTWTPDDIYAVFDRVYFQPGFMQRVTIMMLHFRAQMGLTPTQ